MVRSVEWMMDNRAANYQNINASGASTEQMINNYIQLCCVLNYRQGSLSLSFSLPIPFIMIQMLQSKPTNTHDLLELQ